MVEIPMTFYHDPSEQLRGVLGQNYVTSVISEKKVQKSLMVLTNKRLYQTGKVFEKGIGNKFISSAGKKNVSVKDITGTAYKEENRWPMLVVGLIVFFICFAIGANEGGDDFPIFVVIGLVFSSPCFLGYFFSRKRWFIIEYAGGAIATPCKWYSPDEIEEFQRKISIEKDRIAKEKQS